MDEQILLWINLGWAHPWLDWFFAWISQRAAFSWPLTGLIVVILGLKYGRDGWKLGLLLVLAIALGDQFAHLLKHLLQEPRPCAVLYEIIRQPTRVTGVTCGAMTSGMPSSHAFNFALTAAFLGWVLSSWRWGLTLGGLACTVGISRIYLGAHYPHHVLAGLALGVVTGLLASHAALRYATFANRIHNIKKAQAHE